MSIKYDCVLIGNNLVNYMASIYLQTSGLKILVLKTKDDKNSFDFDGYDMIAGVNASSKEELVNDLEKQSKYLKCDVRECDECIVEVYFDVEVQCDECCLEKYKEIISKEIICNGGHLQNDVCVDKDVCKNIKTNDKYLKEDSSQKINSEVHCEEKINKKEGISKNKSSNDKKDFKINVLDNIKINFISTKDEKDFKKIKTNDETISYKIKSQHFLIKVNSESYKSKTVLCKDNLFDELSGFYYSYDGIKYKQAIELCGLGCKKSFSIRDYCSSVE